MLFSIHKSVREKKRPPLEGLVNVLILVIIIPVVMITVVSLTVYFLFDWLRGLIKREKNIETPLQNYHLERDLVNNEHVHIIMVEDELDNELTWQNETWTDRVFHKETSLYRAETVPAIAGLNGLVCCYYCKEQEDGVILQIPTFKSINGMVEPGSSLVFLDYQNLKITPVDETGAFFLYNDEKNDRVIHGFNVKEIIRLEVTRNH